MDEANKAFQDYLVYLNQCSFDRRCEIKEELRTNDDELYFNAMANVIELSGDGPIVMHFTMFFSGGFNKGLKN